MCVYIYINSTHLKLKPTEINGFKNSRYSFFSQ